MEGLWHLFYRVNVMLALIIDPGIREKIVQMKTPSVNRGNTVAELTTMRSIGVTGGLNYA